MIKSVEVSNHRDETISLVLNNPVDGLILKNIEGLGPPVAYINSSSIALMDGIVFNSSRVSGRNLRFEILFNGKPDIETVRQLTYKYFPIKKKIRLRFKTDHRDVETFGYVESNDPYVFDKQTSTIISILCESAYFTTYGKDGLTTVYFFGVDSKFEFPFSNESLTQKLLEFGNILNRDLSNIPYMGDADTGVLMNIHAIGPVGDITIHNTRTMEQFTIDSAKLSAITGRGLDNGDDILINTNKGSKSIYLYRDGILTNIMNVLGLNTDWFTLIHGDNPFSYTTSFGEENLQFKVEYYALYEGI